MTSRSMPVVAISLMPYVYGSDMRYHPAIRHGSQVWYWPNITYSTEKGAYDWANSALENIRFGAQSIVDEWNLYPID